MSYFSQKGGDTKTETKTLDAAPAESRYEAPARKGAAVNLSATEIVSTLGPGLLITGNVVSTGSVQIHGRVIGDIHAARVMLSKGAYVEGKVTAQEAVIDGTFKGAIYGNSVKLQATAVVDGEIFKQSLVIEQNAQFEGVSRRLETAVEAPTNDAVSGQKSAQVINLVPDTSYENGHGSHDSNGQSY